MQVTETNAEGLKRTLQIVVGANELSDRFNARLNEVKDTIQLKGFRRGKVPVGHIKKVYGRSLMAEVLQDTVEKTSAQALTDRNERPAAQPAIKFPEDQAEIERVVEGKGDLAYTMSFEVLPKIEVTDLSALKLEREVADVEDAAVEDAIKEIAARNVRHEVEEGRVAEDGDQLTIDYVGRVDGAEFEGGKGEDMELVLGRGGFIPGFEDGLKGAKAGDERTVRPTFPADYPVPALAGKDAEFAVKVKAVAKPITPAIDDDLAKGFGMESLEQLRERVKQQIAAEYQQISRNKLKRALLDALDGTHSFELPASLVDQEFDGIWASVTENLKRAGKTLEDEGRTEDSAKEEYRKIAERRVRLGLILADIGEKAKVEVTQDELRNALFQEARRYPGQERMVYEYFEKTPGAVQQLRAPIFEDKVVDYILEQAKPTERKVSREDLLKMPEGDDAPAA